jgi:CcmD family protein
MNSNMLMLAATPIVVWLGVFIYMLSIDRKLAKLEQTRKEDDL